MEGFCEDDVRLGEAMANVFAQAMRCYSLSETGSQLLARANSYREVQNPPSACKHNPLTWRYLKVLALLQGMQRRSLDQLIELSLDLVGALCGRLYLVGPDGKSLKAEIFKGAIPEVPVLRAGF